MWQTLCLSSGDTQVSVILCLPWGFSQIRHIHNFRTRQKLDGKERMYRISTGKDSESKQHSLQAIWAFRTEGLLVGVERRVGEHREIVIEKMMAFELNLERWEFWMYRDLNRIEVEGQSGQRNSLGQAWSTDVTCFNGPSRKLSLEKTKL